MPSKKKTWVKILQPAIQGLSEQAVRLAFIEFLLKEMKVKNLKSETVERFITKCREEMADGSH